MKKFFTLILMAALTAGSANAQVTEIWKGGIMQAKVQVADSIRVTNNVLSREEIQAWAQAHIDSLARVAWNTVQTGDAANTRDPDQNREVFRSIGYDGRNVYQFLLGGDVVDAAILDSLMAKAKKANNNKVVIVAGHSSAGKSSSIRNVQSIQDLVKGAGIVLDEVWTDRTKLKEILQTLKDKGFTEQSMILVYRQPEASFKSACDRFLRTGRAVGLNFFIGESLFTSYQGYVANFMENDLKNMGVTRYYLDNTGTAAKAVDATAAEQWDYTLSDAQKQKMAYDLYEYIWTNKDKISYRDAWALFYDE